MVILLIKKLELEYQGSEEHMYYT